MKTSRDPDRGIDSSEVNIFLHFYFHAEAKLTIPPTLSNLGPEPRPLTGNKMSGINGRIPDDEGIDYSDIEAR